MSVSGNEDRSVPPAKWEQDMLDLQQMKEEPLHPDLVPWVEEDGIWGKQLRHPLVYAIPLILPGQVNKAYAYKKAAIQKAQEEEAWSTYVFLHERPYRLRALLDLTGRSLDPFSQDEDIIPLCQVEREFWPLATDVWVDCENIMQNIEEWRALFAGAGEADCDLWLGTEEDRAAFDAMPDSILAYRGGSAGDWSWTTDQKVAEFFSRRSGLPVRADWIPKADVFGYITQRSESELLVKMTEARYHRVYPNGEPGS